MDPLTDAQHDNLAMFLTGEKVKSVLGVGGVMGTTL